MKKPEKITEHYKMKVNGKVNDAYASSFFNQACDVWEKYHEQEIKLLELFLKNTRNDLKSLKDNLPNEGEIHDIWFKTTGIEISVNISKGLTEIHKRLRGEV